MAGGTTDIQWYIARDGKQHGPISDVEMRTFVDLGHLKPTDLLWRAGFPDWRPAPMVFPPKRMTPPPPPRPPENIEPAAAHRLEPVGTPQTQAPAGRAGPQQRAAPAQDPRTGPAPGYAQPDPTAATHNQSHAAETAGRPAAAARPQQPEHPAREQPAPFFPLERHDVDEEEDAYEPKPGRTGFRIAAVLVTIVLLACGAWLAYQFRDRLVALAVGGGEAATPAVVRAPEAPAKSAAAPVPETTTAAVPAPASSAADDPSLAAIDARYQKTPLWSIAKREFPDWYDERMRAVAELEGKQAPPTAISKYLVEQLVTLRRRNADQALASSPARLKSIAHAFLDNLRRMTAHGAETCYGFISQGEVNPRVLELFQDPEQAAPIEAQAQTILEAIAEGRSAPNTYAKPQKSDYELLTVQLAKLGWTQADMQLFSDPKALARAEPIRICKMVQDWFIAHIAIEDSAAQDRLLFETLRPVVAG